MTAELAAHDTWLTIAEAADRLGVHPSTLRRWANAGEIPVLMTPGGHRRFSSRDVEAFAAKRRSLRLADLESLVVEQALDHTRKALVDHPAAPWLTSLDPADRERKRLLGRRLMGLMLQHISQAGDGGAILDEARAIGREYAANARERSFPVAIPLQAAMFFRDAVLESALSLPDTTRVTTQDNLRLVRRISHLLNAVELAIVEAYG